MINMTAEEAIIFQENVTKQTNEAVNNFLTGITNQLNEVSKCVDITVKTFHSVYSQELEIFRVMEAKIIIASQAEQDIAPAINEGFEKLSQFRLKLQAQNAEHLRQREQLKSEPAAGQG